MADPLAEAVRFAEMAAGSLDTAKTLPTIEQQIVLINVAQVQATIAEAYARIHSGIMVERATKTQEEVARMAAIAGMSGGARA